MPAWGEWMPLQNRWNVIAYIESFVTQMSLQGNNQVVPSVYDNGKVAVNFAQVSTELWKEEGHSINVQNGADLYQKFCSSCHGDNGQGIQPNTAGAFPGGLSYPAPLPAKMPFNYIFWRIWDGVPDTRMGPFSTLLTESDIFDLSSYLNNPGSASESSSSPQPTLTPTPGG